MADVEVARTFAVGGIVGVVGLRAGGIAVAGIVVDALRQRVVVLRVDAVPAVLAIRELDAVVPRLAVVGQLIDVAQVGILRPERTDQVGCGD